MTAVVYFLSSSSFASLARFFSSLGTFFRSSTRRLCHSKMGRKSIFANSTTRPRSSARSIARKSRQKFSMNLGFVT